MHKFGLKLPKNIQQAQDIDRGNSNTFCQDAIATEMNNLQVAFRLVKDEDKIPVQQHVSFRGLIT